MAREKMCCNGSGWGKLFFGLFIFLVGVSWLGNEMGWWVFSLPWLPLAVTLVGAALLIKWFIRGD